MKKQCAPTITKFFVIVLNVIFWISGPVLIAASSACLASSTLEYIYKSANEYTIKNILFGILITGFILIVVGIIGYYGATKESKAMLKAYTGFVLAVILLEISFAIYIGSQKTTIEQNIANGYNVTTMQNYGLGSFATTNSVDNVQQALSCCGLLNYGDWTLTAWYRNISSKANIFVPSSCCISPKCETKPNQQTVFSDGCVSVINKNIDYYFPVVIAVAVCLALFKVFIVLCAIYFIRYMKKEPLVEEVPPQ